jgi:transposase
VTLRRCYPSDLTDEEWALLEPLIPAPKPGGRPAKVSRREIMNAILYVLKNGIPWRAMPHDLPHWSTVYHYFRQWQKEGVWEKAVQALVMDSQSVVTSEARTLQTTEKGGPGETMGRKRSKGESARS